MPTSKMIIPQGFVAPHTLAGMPKGTPVLLALSGGSDSCALLHMLAACARVDGFPLTAAHVNHGIRGEEAIRDREFCRRLAADYGVEIRILDADVPALAKAHGTGLEDEGRRVRYEFFEHVMKEENIPLLVTAHHADDNMETVLFHLCRGTGLGGLCGIAPVRSFANGFLVRPLLQVTHREILEFCRINSLEYVTDSTNADTFYTRNRIRAEVLPVLEDLFTMPQRRVSEMTRSLREDEKLLSAMAEELYTSAYKSKGLSIARLRQAPLPIVKRALMRWVRENTHRDAERVHLDALLDLIKGEPLNARVALPGDLDAVAEFDTLRLLDRNEQADTRFCFPFTCGEILLEGSGIRITVEKKEKLTKVNNLSTQSYIILNVISDIMEHGFYWRTRRPGDMILRGGMHRKLRKLYAEVGVPPRWRERMPLLCDGEGIVWAPFVGARDGLPAGGEPYLVSVMLLTDAD